MGWLIHIVFLTGFVYRYKNQNVAIKIINKGDTSEEIAKKEARFAREVAMLSRVQHKNLVKVVCFNFFFFFVIMSNFYFYYLFCTDMIFDNEDYGCINRYIIFQLTVYWSLQ